MIYSLMIKLTHKCNIRCAYCYERETVTDYESVMDLEVMRHLVKILQDTKEKFTFFFLGGEILILDDDYLQQVFDIIRPVANEIQIQTNGTLLTEEKCAMLNKNGVHLGISYDGTTSKINRGKIEHCEKGLENWTKEIQKSVGVLSVCSKEYLENIITEYEHCKNKGISGVQYGILRGSEGNDQYADLFISQIKKMVDYYWEDETPIMNNFVVELIKTALGVPNSLTTLKCHEQWLGLDVDGGITLCDCGVWGYSNEDYLIGNILNLNNLNEFILNEKRLNIIEKVLEMKEECIDCELDGICWNGCVAQTFKDSRDGPIKINKTWCKMVLETQRYVKEKIKVPTKNHFVKEAIEDASINN